MNAYEAVQHLSCEFACETVELRHFDATLEASYEYIIGSKYYSNKILFLFAISHSYHLPPFYPDFRNNEDFRRNIVYRLKGPKSKIAEHEHLEGTLKFLKVKAFAVEFGECGFLQVFARAIEVREPLEIRKGAEL